MPEIPDLEVESEGFGVWEIENYRSLSKREHGPLFHSGVHPWFEEGHSSASILSLIGTRRILLFPYGNNVEHASFYLEQGYEDKPPEGWYACVQFVLVLWNKNDPSIYYHNSIVLPNRKIEGFS